MYKLFYFDFFDRPVYKPVKGLWPSLNSFFDFLVSRFGYCINDTFWSSVNFIKIPFNGVHDSEATGYPLSDILYRAPRVSLGAKREGPGK